MAKEKAVKEEAQGVPVGGALPEINTEGIEAAPGVDTTAEGLAMKYKQPLPEGVKPVLGKDAINPKKAAETANVVTAEDEPLKTEPAPARRSNASKPKAAPHGTKPRNRSTK